MKKINFKSISVLMTLTLLLSCNAYKNTNKTQRGAGIGAAGGAVIGGVIGNNVGKGNNTALGAILGAVIGGAAGGYIGNRMDRQAERIEEEIPGAVVSRVGEGINVTFNDLTRDHSTIVDGKQIIVLNELVLSGGGKEGKVLSNKIKPYITDPTLIINPKGKQEIEIPNFCNFFMFSNDRKPMKIDPEDRRLFVITIDKKKFEVFMQSQDLLNQLKIVLH